MNTPEEIYVETYSYIIIICSNFVQSFNLHFKSDRKQPDISIFFDFIRCFEYHSGFLCLIYIIKKVKILHLSKEELTFHKALAKEELLIALPMALQY